uniref:Large ribosomal subunit protein eL28 n=1 Tax=Plectus sambesii TaxID=2011161 RepID=A0A914VKV8_9BILA
MAGIPTDLQWQIIRNNTSFRRRCRGIPKHFSTEPFNLMGVHSIRYNGLVHKKAIDIRPTKDNKGVQLVIKNGKRANKPAKATTTVTLKKNSRTSLKSVKKVAKAYRGSQVMVRTFYHYRIF